MSRAALRHPSLGSVLAMVLILALALPVLYLGVATPPPAARAQVAAELPVEELTDLEQLRVRFNHDLGKPRLILLLSPT
jgi:hypothetical protein